MTDTATGQTFGPSALATPANVLTVARLLATPVFVALIVTQGATWTTSGVGAVVAFSDGFDGWLARRQGTTRSGAFLDPLADKFVVLGAMFALAAKGHLPWVAVGIIAAREIGLIGYRSWAGRRGISMPARTSAKVKTLVQDLAIASCVLPFLAHQHTTQLVMIWLAVALTVATGVQYVVDGRRAIPAVAAQGPATGDDDQG